MPVRRIAIAIALILAPSAASAQLGAAAHAGSLGLGVDVGFAFTPMVGIRVGGNIQPMTFEATVSDVLVSGQPASPAFTGMLDFYPTRAGFRLSGGAVLFSGAHSFEGRPAGDVELDGITFDGAMVGSLNATIHTREVAPYAGIGWGGATRSGLGLLVDLGVAMHGRPTVSVVVDGPLAGEPVFQAALDREVAEFQDDVSGYTFYPVASIGLSFAAR